MPFAPTISATPIDKIKGSKGGKSCCHPRSERHSRLCHRRNRTADSPDFIHILDRCAQCRGPYRRQGDGFIQNNPRRPVRQDDNPIREKNRFHDRMGDKQHSHAQRAPNFAELHLQSMTGRLVQGGKGLVEEQQVRPRRQSPRHRCAHLHAAGKFVGITRGEFRQMNPPQLFFSARVGLVAVTIPRVPMAKWCCATRCATASRSALEKQNRAKARRPSLRSPAVRYPLDRVRRSASREKTCRSRKGQAKRQIHSVSYL